MPWEEIKKGKADFAVLPIENSTAGIVQDIYDLLEQIEDGVMEHVLEMMRGFHPNREEDVSRRYFECFCQYIYENRTVYCVLTNGQESRFIKKLLRMISEYMAGLSGKENDGDKQSREYAVCLFHRRRGGRPFISG